MFMVLYIFCRHTLKLYKGPDLDQERGDFRLNFMEFLDEPWTGYLF